MHPADLNTVKITPPTTVTVTGPGYHASVAFDDATASTISRSFSVLGEGVLQAAAALHTFANRGAVPSGLEDLISGVRPVQPAGRRPKSKKPAPKKYKPKMPGPKTKTA
jgi:hypothetical protein